MKDSFIYHYFIISHLNVNHCLFCVPYNDIVFYYYSDTRFGNDNNSNIDSLCVHDLYIYIKKGQQPMLPLLLPLILIITIISIIIIVTILPNCNILLFLFRILIILIYFHRMCIIKNRF